MRPDPDELLRLMRTSLKTAVTPAIPDEWAAYVAKSIERMLEHLERRWTNEIRFLAEDTLEMRDLFARLRTDLQTRGAPINDRIRQTIDTFDGLLSDASLAEHAVTYQEISAENQAHRGALEQLILGLDALGDDPGADALRTPIRAYLGAQLARDVELAEPTFMRFGAPTPK